MKICGKCYEEISEEEFYENKEDRYEELMNELNNIVNEIRIYYDIGKVKESSVYIWTFGKDGQNVFDIWSDKICYYEKHNIFKEALSIISKIQKQLMIIENEIIKGDDRL